MLMEGYELDAQVGDRVMKLTIPPGGVEKGQKFKVSMNQETATDKSKVPVGHWKDALCDCCRYGLLHATCFISCCFPALAAAQVINRMGLNWLGYPARNEAEKTSAFRTVFIITVVQLGLRPLGYTIFQIIYFLFSFFIVMNVRWENQISHMYTTVSFNLFWHELPLTNFFLLAFIPLKTLRLSPLRSYVRAKYAIPETSCCLNGTEDCCVSYWCLWCTASQMLRHTGNYEMYAAGDCSENGFSPHVKAVTVWPI